ncbi:MAG: hypothetical protein KC619_21960, partial [Myxococcales bacterium]|nr:hypothetical protein [Myxococcales bacterium]
MTRTIWGIALAALALAAGCGPDAPLDRTLATIERVRGEATLDDEPLERIGRAVPGQTIAIEEGGLARLSLDSGARFLLDASARVAIVDEATVRLEGGRAYAEAGEGEELFLTAGERSLRVSDASVSAELGDALAVYVVRGEVSWRAGEARGIARAGERLTLAATEGSTEPVTLWRDWTGGLARPGPADARGPEGVGVLEARVPDEVGQARWPLVIRRLDVQVRIVGDLAVTEVEQVFFNPASEMVEGLYRIRVPEEAVLQRFAVDRNGHLVDGYVREKAQAQAAYEAQVYRGSQLDPALLEWVAPGRYRARIYPIRPGETRRIVVRYAEWLAPIEEGGPRLYRYPMGGGRDAPRVQELSIAIDVEEAGVERLAAGMGAAVEGGRVRLRRSDFAPRSDFWLELHGPEQGLRAWRAPHEPPPRAPDARTVVGEADERDYFYLPLRLPERLFADARAEGVDVVIVADVSAATDRSHLELGRSVAEALTAHLGANDRVAIVTSDLTIRSPIEGAPALGEASAERVEALLDGLARVPAGGATDLGAAVAAAAELLDPDRPGAVIYVGDGAPTVGELEADGLLERIARLPAPLRLYAVGVGSDANLDLLEALTRGGGLALRVEERSQAADAALRLLGHATRPVAQRVTVDLGTGIENVYPRRPVDVVEGEILSVSGRIREQPPQSVHVHGTIAGTEFDEELPIQTLTTEQSTDLRLRWAGERLRQHLLEGAGREEVAELGVRYGLITPFSSYYVPSAQELNQYGPMGLRWIDRPDLLQEVDLERRASASGLDAIFAVAMGPFAIAGCAGGDDAPAAVSSADSMEEPGWATPTSEEATAAPSPVMEVPPAEPEPALAPPGATPTPAPVVAAPAPSQPTTGAGSTTTGAFFGRQQAGEVLDPWQAPPADDAPVAGLDGVGAGGGGYAQGAAMPDNAAVANLERRESARTRGPSLPMRLGGRTAEDRGDMNRDMDEIVARALGEESQAARASGINAVARRRLPPASIDDGEDGSRVSNALDALGLRGNESTTITIRTTTTERGPSHERRQCSDASRLSLDDREELWAERIGAAGGP